MKVFGIGCIYFGYKSSDDLSVSKSEDQDVYFDTLKSTLEGMENISNLAFHNLSDTYFNSILTLAEGNDEILVPIARGGARLEFDIFIPFRVQNQLITLCDVETIHVDIIYGYEAPLAIMSYEWPDEEGDAQPSMTVAVVRKFLEKKMTDSPLICGSVGPSPFHANFSIIESELAEIPSIKDTSENLIGYANLEINSPANGSLLDAITSANLDTILSTFYQLSDLRSRAIDTHSMIIENSRQLLDQEAPNSLLAKLNLFRNHSRFVDNLNSSIFKEMLLRLNMSQALADNDRMEITGDNLTMNRFFDEYRSMATEQTWSKFAEVAKFFEERRQKMIGNAAAIVAGIVGGVIGSVIGSLATYILTRVG